MSPRRQRLRTALISLAILLALGTAFSALLYLRSRPSQYRPDEQSSDITSSLARQLPADAPTPRFTDTTARAGLGGFHNFIGDRTSQLPEDMGPGLAWGDFDNDGDDDLFVVSAGGPLNAAPETLASCALYENLGEGTFRKVEAFPELRIHGMSAAWGDCDGDGFLDLIITGYNALLLLHNERGSGKFARDARFPDLKGFWAGASWGDYDNDRALDLYVCGYVQYVENETDRGKISQQIGSAVPYTLNPASYTPGTNLLFHNNGDGSFTEVGGPLKVQNPEGRSLGALWHDFDDDGWLDLYVANDISDNVFYHNTGGKFEDISHPALVADYRSAMGLAAGDFDRDGDDDLYITHWVAQENALYQNLWADFNSKPKAGNSSSSPRLNGERVRGETLRAGSFPHKPASSATNSAPLRFLDVADMQGLGQMALPYVGWGTEFADFDGDGWPDIIVANGNTIEADGPPPRKLKPQEAFLLWNRRGEHFHNLGPLNKSLSEQHGSRGLALADYDNDGALDIAIAQLGEGVQLLHNEMQTGHWLKVQLRSLTKDRQPLGFGDGTRVIAHIGTVGLRRTISSVSYLSQSSHMLHFGLGDATRVDRLEVRWHAGATNFFDNLDANATYEITEGEPTPKRSSPSPLNGVRGETVRLRSPTETADSSTTDKQRLVEFWAKERAAMNAMKVEKDNGKAIALFREALALNPNHEDSRYYLGLCLAHQNDPDGALAQLDELKRINPQSHRAWQQSGVLRATFAKTDADLLAAEKSLERAHALNPEETGALLVLGEISLMRADHAKADQQLAAACRTNPKAVGGFFLRAYLAWKAGDDSGASRLLESARGALGKDWQPLGATSEGDVKQKQHVEATPLTPFWESWDGTTNPKRSFAKLESFLKNQFR